MFDFLLDVISDDGNPDFVVPLITPERAKDFFIMFVLGFVMGILVTVIVNFLIKIFKDFKSTSHENNEDDINNDKEE